MIVTDAGSAPTPVLGLGAPAIDLGQAAGARLLLTSGFDDFAPATLATPATPAAATLATTAGAMATGASAPTAGTSTPAQTNSAPAAIDPSLLRFVATPPLTASAPSVPSAPSASTQDAGSSQRAPATPGQGPAGGDSSGAQNSAQTATPTTASAPQLAPPSALAVSIGGAATSQAAPQSAPLAGASPTSRIKAAGVDAAGKLVDGTRTASVQDFAAAPAKAAVLGGSPSSPQLAAAVADDAQPGQGQNRQAQGAGPDQSPAPSAVASAEASAPAQVSLAATTAAFAAANGAQITAQIASQIARRSDGAASRFDFALEPQGLGRVDVKLRIGSDGQLSALLSFDNPAAAAEAKGRSADLQQSLQQAGFDVSQSGLSFSSGGQGQGASAQQPWQTSLPGAIAPEAPSDVNAVPSIAARSPGSGGLDITI
ncbi:MAG: flagellar hook-length control protein FliK [Caulobacterales bacterium]